MVVGARTGEKRPIFQASLHPQIFPAALDVLDRQAKHPGHQFGYAGFFRKPIVEKFFSILPDTFSFTVTITLAMLTNYQPVLFVPISYSPRLGKSKIKPIRDTLQFVLLILRTGVYFAPVRFFGPITLVLTLFALAHLSYDVFVLDDITDTSLLLFLFAFNTGMLTLLADMIDKRAGG